MLGMLSDVGNVRKINEDCVGYWEGNEIRFYVIADGMGGHNAGEVASHMAVEISIDEVKASYNDKDIEGILLRAINNANSKIYDMSQSDESLKGMGTTITACFIRNNDIVIANVGDSSGIVIKGGEIIKVTKDHSLVQELLDSGNITEEEAINHPNKNIITRALGIKDSVEVDIFNLKLEGITKIVLATDGLTNVVSLDEIYEIINNSYTEECCSQLVELSKIKGSKDNISVIVFEGECKDDWNYTRE